MTLSLFRALPALFALVFLAGCSGPKTPQEVAEAFWQAVAENDTDEVMEFSTLSVPADFDAIAGDWTGAQPSFGRVVIDEGEATIVTRVPAPDAPNGQPRELLTYLVDGVEGWQVDYQRTTDTLLNPSPLSSLMGELNRLGEKLAASFSSSSDDLEARMNELARQLEQYSADMESKAEAAIETFAERLQEAIEGLEESINDAIEDEGSAPPQDRIILEQASMSLEREVEALEEPTMEVLAKTSRTLAETGERFTQLSAQTYDKYQDEWLATLQDIRRDTEAFFADLHQSLVREG